MAVPDSDTTMDLPPGFNRIADILNGKVNKGELVSVIGVVVDFQMPRSNNGPDHKSTMRLIDLSSSSQNQNIQFNLFRPLKDLPERVGAGDVVVVYKAKYQVYRSDPYSLITNFATAIHVYPAANIPPSPALTASCPLKFSGNDKKHTPTPKDGQYVSWLFHKVNKDYIPDVEHFELRAQQSLNIKNKLCELKDAKDGTFHDIIAQVVQEPYDFGDKIRLYVSDYTENSGFFNHTRTGQTGKSSRDGDPFGYTTAKDSKSSIWNGPFGKRSLQVTCWEPHATVIRDRVKNGSWVHLFNVQFKFGSNSMNLEGYLREDQNAFRNKISVDVLDFSEGPEHIHPSLKGAIRRKREYEKEEKALHKDLQPIQTKSRKRPAPGQQPEDKPLNAKQRRAVQRAQVEGKARQDVAPVDAGLNTQVVTEHPEQAIVSVSDLLESTKFETTYRGAPLFIDLPFNCARYRTNVRVIDFYPNRLQDFARARKQQTEYEALSDYSGEESESEEEGGTLNDFVSTSDRIWEWRFALRLQGVTNMPNNSKPRKDNSFWVVVGNMSAQLLTSMDACDLRTAPDELAQLRERLFILWGDLEEKKSKALANKRKKQKANGGKKVAGDRPPDSSDNEGPKEPSKETETISNRPFTCCIHQYGIQVKESNPDKANAGEGKRWKRMFGLFGTQIRYNN